MTTVSLCQSVAQTPSDEHQHTVQLSSEWSVYSHVVSFGLVYTEAILCQAFFKVSPFLPVKMNFDVFKTD